MCTKSGRANQKAQMSFPSAITRLTQSVKSADSSDEQQNQAIKLTLRGQSYRSRETDYSSLFPPRAERARQLFREPSGEARGASRGLGHMFGVRKGRR